MESIEEQWRKDSSDLCNVIAKLQEDNRRLVRVQSTTGPTDKGDDVETSGVPANGEILQQMKDTIEKQRDDIRSKEKEMQEKINEIDNVRFFNRYLYCFLNCRNRLTRHPHLFCTIVIQ